MSQILTIPDDVIDRNQPVTPPLDETEAARRYGRLLQASAGAARALGGLEGRFAGEPDWATAPDRFRAEADAIGRDFADSFGDDRTGRTLFSRDFASLSDARSAAFAGTCEKREREGVRAAYAERMAGLAQMARSSDGPQRAEVLRQAALEVHRAQAFGFEGDPGAAMDRFTVWITPEKSESVGKPQARPALASGQAANSFGFLDIADVQKGRDRYTEVQNTGEPREARTPENIGKDYWAAKKALDVDPNDVKSQEALAKAHRELDLYVVKKVVGNVVRDSAEEEVFGVNKLVALTPPMVKLIWKAVNIREAVNTYQEARDEVEKVRSGR